MLADDWDNPQQFPAISAQQEGSSSANNDGIPQQSVWREILPGESCLLTVGHSWVVFYQHPKQQRGSSVWGVVHLPWLFCWWRHCPPTSRVRFFPSFFQLWWREYAGPNRARICVAETGKSGEITVGSRGVSVSGPHNRKCQVSANESSVKDDDDVRGQVPDRALFPLPTPLDALQNWIKIPNFLSWLPE